MQRIRILKNHKPLAFVDSNTLLISCVNKLFIYNIKLDKKEYINQIPLSYANTFFSKFALLQRLLRLEFRYAFKRDDKNYFVVFGNKIFNLNLPGATVTAEKVSGRPLTICKVAGIPGFSDMMCFGEYKANLEKDEVHIYGLVNNSWQVLYTFPKGEIDHIHSIIADVYRQHVWILTGDFGKGAGIWIAKNNFKNVEPVLRESQMYRSCVAFAVKEGLLYATDSQMEVNKIMLLRENGGSGWIGEPVNNINGSCIYGAKYKNNFVFSTTVEPYGGEDKAAILRSYLGTRRGSGILSDSSEILFCSSDFRVSKMYENKKDSLPFLFQFGSTSFPTGMQTSDYFVFYNMALQENNMCTEIWQ